MSRPYDARVAKLTKAINRVNETLNTTSNNNNKIPVGRYNCWGFVAGMLNWVSEFKWVHQYEMEEFLEKKSVPVTDKPRVGDIAVWKMNGQLTHTSFMLNRISHIHKPGGWPLTIDRRKYIETSDDYAPHYGSIFEFRRPLAIG